MATTADKPIRPPARRVGLPTADLPAGLPDATGKTLRAPVSIADADAEPPADRVFPPEPAPHGARSQITLSTVVEHRGRLITIAATDMTADQFCDLLDKRGFQAPTQAQEWQRLPDGTPICPKHRAPMRLRERQGDSWYSHNVGTKEAPVYCKGYHGKDSPGYEL